MLALPGLEQVEGGDCNLSSSDGLGTKMCCYGNVVLAKQLGRPSVGWLGAINILRERAVETVTTLTHQSFTEDNSSPFKE